ncbi:uncharacterized protein YqhO-like [Pecten maximus]|uniref:uncharacterized protein YqhO-like n=1 Tax=Pecten maximus TaxID=6579 RepID=UPI0014582DC5|nr:uncharacterized protein YqhO-like [Pecten maximus]
MGNKASHQVVETDTDFDDFDGPPPAPPTELELRARQINPAEHVYPFENLVFEGGGSKGMAYCGAVRALEDCGMFPQIKRFAGTSAGALTAALMSVGYNSHDVEIFMRNDMSKNFMLDGSFVWRLFTFIPRFVFGYGLSPASRLNNWLGERFREKTGSDDITFKQLYEFNGKELCIVVTNVNNMAEEYCHPKTTPDMPVRLAVRMSMSIPGMFQVVKYSHNPQSPSNMYIDGGVLCNYPIHCFDGWWLSMKPKDAFVRRMHDLDQLPAMLSKACRFGERSDKTLGFLVYSEAEADNFRFYLEKRTPVLSRSNSTLNRKRRTELIAKSRDRKRISAAVSRFFPLLDKYEADLDGKINDQEFQNIYDHISEEDRHTLFGDLGGSNAVFKRLDGNGNGLVTFQEIIQYIEGRGLAVNQRYLGYKRQDVTGIVSYASTILGTVLLNLKRLHMEYDDLGRTVGINTGHIETADFDLEEEDIIFLLDQGRTTTIDFLKMYAAKEIEK